MNQLGKIIRAVIAITTLGVAGAIAGCGEVVVFGHVVREGKSKSAEAETPVPSESEPPDSKQPDSKQPGPTPPDSKGVEQKSTQTQSAAAVPLTKPVATATLQRLNAVSVVLTTAAAAKANGDSKFKLDALTAAIKSELHSLKVLDESDSQVTASAEFSIDQYELHRTTNVIIFGKMSYAGTLNGSIRVRDSQGNVSSVRRAEAKSRFSVPAEGEVENPLEPLYRQFAIQAGNALTGKAPKSDE